MHKGLGTYSHLVFTLVLVTLLNGCSSHSNNEVSNGKMAIANGWARIRATSCNPAEQNTNCEVVKTFGVTSNGQFRASIEGRPDSENSGMIAQDELNKLINLANTFVEGNDGDVTNCELAGNLSLDEQIVLNSGALLSISSLTTDKNWICHNGNLEEATRLSRLISGFIAKYRPN